MERRRSSQVLAIVALLLAVGGLSLGFAAFTETLTIRSSAEVKPASEFDVDFQTTAGTEAAVTATTSGSGTVSGDNATIANDSAGNPTIGGLKANFTQPGQTVTYTFRVANTGKLQAYLKSVTFANVTGTNPASYKKCEANATNTSGDTTTTATPSLVADACNGISMTVQVGSRTAFSGSDTINDATGLNPVDSNNAVVSGGYEAVVVTITYASDAARADGDFTVTFGDVSLVYSSVAGTGTGA